MGLRRDPLSGKYTKMLGLVSQMVGKLIELA